MNKRQIILGLKRPSEFTLSERQQIVEEYLLTKCKKRDIWEKYTGEKEEHGQILRWMRQLGYEIEPKYSKLAINRTDIMAKRDSKETIEELQMKEKIKHLEQALVNSELRATALEMMIEVAEKELKINIRKKSNTKPSSK